MYLILSFLYVVVLFPTRIRGNSLLIAKLCPGEHCSHQPEHPILDYTHEKGCHCTRHPCWDDDGKFMTESDHCRTNIHIQDNTCRCSATLTMTLHILQNDVSRTLCDDKDTTPILDYDQTESKCICRSHPCWNEGSTQVKIKFLFYTIVQKEKMALSTGCECYKI